MNDKQIDVIHAMFLKPPRIQVVEIESREHAQRLGNLSRTFRNQIRRTIGKHSDTVFAYNCGTVLSHRDGKEYDWFLTDGKISIHPAK